MKHSSRETQYKLLGDIPYNRALNSTCNMEPRTLYHSPVRHEEWHPGRRKIFGKYNTKQSSYKAQNITQRPLDKRSNIAPTETSDIAQRVGYKQ